MSDAAIRAAALTDRKNGRLRALDKELEAKRAALEAAKASSEAEAKKGAGLEADFGTGQSSVEAALSAATVGLQQLDEYTAKRKAAEKEAETAKLVQTMAQTKSSSAGAAVGGLKRKGGADVKKLSFAMNDSDDSDSDSDSDASNSGSKSTSSKSKSGETADVEERLAKKPRMGKNPFVETGFLPDAEREAAKAAEVARLAAEYEAAQDRVKAQKLEIVYSYWDGTGHRKTTTVTKGTSIGQFLNQVRMEVHDLRNAPLDTLMYIKEDLIMPHHYTFYELIVTKARGKSGPLFNFDVHDDIRLTVDSRVEKDESHAGKVLERRWYDKNKHIFPASRWELYDPNVDYGEYTIHGDGVVKRGDGYK